MIQRHLLIPLTLTLILMVSGCTLQANFESGDPASTRMPVSIYYSEASDSSVSDPTAEPTAEASASLPPRVSLSAQSTASQRATRTPTPTPGVPAVGSQSGGSRRHATPSPTSAAQYPTQCPLVHPTGLVTYDMPVQEYPGTAYVNDVVGELHAGETVTLTGWWNDGTQPWWQVAYSGGEGWILGQTLEVQESGDCGFYMPYIIPENSTSTPTPVSEVRYALIVEAKSGSISSMTEYHGGGSYVVMIRVDGIPAPADPNIYADENYRNVAISLSCEGTGTQSLIWGYWLAGSSWGCGYVENAIVKYGNNEVYLELNVPLDGTAAITYTLMATVSAYSTKP